MTQTRGIRRHFETTKSASKSTSRFTNSRKKRWIPAKNSITLEYFTRILLRRSLNNQGKKMKKDTNSWFGLIIHSDVHDHTTLFPPCRSLVVNKKFTYAKKRKTKIQNKQNLSSVLNEILPFNHFFELKYVTTFKNVEKKRWNLKCFFFAVSGSE
jgi:hypothetical protein